MSSSRKLCLKCKKRFATVVCRGCQQWFCKQDFSVHQMDLVREKEHIHTECDTLEHLVNLAQDDYLSPIIGRINTWESKCIRRIQQVAEQNRIQVCEYFEHEVKMLNSSIGAVKRDIKITEETDNFSEKELQKWMEKLNDLRNMLTNLTKIGLHNANADVSNTISLLKFETANDSVPNRFLSETMLVKQHYLHSDIVLGKNTNYVTRSGADNTPSGLHCPCNAFDDLDEAD